MQFSHSRRRARRFARARTALAAAALFAAWASGGAPAAAAQSTPPAAAPVAPGAVAPGAVAPGPVAPGPVAPVREVTAAEVIGLLDQTVDWYRTLTTQQQEATAPSDVLILYENRQIGDQVLRIAFEIARDEAATIAREGSTTHGASSSEAGASLQQVAQLQAKLQSQRQGTQDELAAIRAQLAHARGVKRNELAAKASELQGVLDLDDARGTLLGTLSQFLGGTGAGLGSDALKAQIDAMAVALPAVSGGAGSSAAAATGAPATAAGGAGSPAAGSPAAGAPSAATTAAASSGAAAAPRAAFAAAAAGESRFGIWDLAADVVRLWDKAATVKDVDRRTLALRAAFAAYRAPLIAHMKTLVGSGDALAAQAGSAPAAALASMRGQFDALSAQFKQISALLIPLSKEEVLLEQYRRNVAVWREDVRARMDGALRTLGIRVGVLLLVLLLVYIGAELWRRAVFRYIKDVRRRQQLLLMRKIVLWSVVVVIVAMAFASELGSVATFAGLITAGIAVAMQSVLVSIVGYFFLIGKYGIRIGDHVQIGEVTGEVIDVGLVRLYLMELGGHGTQGPTGRVVAFPNSIVFQVSSGLFKQIPGVNIAWHELTLALAAGADYTALKDQLLAAVVHALADYRPEIDRQTQEIQRTTDGASAADTNPTVQLRFSATGVEALVRYPVHFRHAAEIDERVSREALRVTRAAAAHPAPVPPPAAQSPPPSAPPP